MKAASLVALVALFCFPGLVHSQCILEEQQDITAQSAISQGDQYGFAVATSGDAGLVGAWLDDQVASNTGAAYVNRNVAGSWVEEQKLVPSDGAADDTYGYAVALSGDVTVVSARLHDQLASNAGAVYVYRFDGAQWNEEQKLTASDGAANDMFGYSVAIDGSRILVGATRHDDVINDSGAAYVFEDQGGTWVEQQKLTATAPGFIDFFGWSVSISGDVAAVGVVNDDVVEVFRWDGLVWVAEQTLTPSDGSGSDRFGYSVAVNGDRIAVGATLASAVYIYDFSVTWSETQKLTASDFGSSDWFGQSVSLYASDLAVGARLNDDLGTDSGSAYLFTHDGVDYQEQFKLLPTTGAGGDEFGHSVAAGPEGVLVGAPLVNAVGSDWGSAYAFPVPDLSLRISPEVVATGDTITIATCNGDPGQFAILFVVEVAGVPVFLTTPASGFFNASGVWSLSAALSMSPGTFDVTFQTLALSSAGPIVSSNREVLSFQ